MYVSPTAGQAIQVASPVFAVPLPVVPFRVKCVESTTVTANTPFAFVFVNTFMIDTVFPVESP